jgi:hypothetical protein
VGVYDGKDLLEKVPDNFKSFFAENPGTICSHGAWREPTCPGRKIA